LSRYFKLGIGPDSRKIGNGRRVAKCAADAWVFEGGVTRLDRAAILRAANKSVSARRSGQANAA
jgi:hypothetical protein